MFLTMFYYIRELYSNGPSPFFFFHSCPIFLSGTLTNFLWCSLNFVVAVSKFLPQNLFLQRSSIKGPIEPFIVFHLHYSYWSHFPTWNRILPYDHSRCFFRSLSKAPVFFTLTPDIRTTAWLLQRDHKHLWHKSSFTITTVQREGSRVNHL